MTQSTTCVAAAICAVALFLLMAAPAGAQNQPPRNGRMSGPPPEALQACADKAIEDACTMTRPRGNETVEGRCVTTPDEKLACLPNGVEQPPSR